METTMNTEQSTPTTFTTPEGEVMEITSVTALNMARLFYADKTAKREAKWGAITTVVSSITVWLVLACVASFAVYGLWYAFDLIAKLVGWK